MRQNFLVHVGSVLTDDPIAVELQGTEVVRGSRRLALPMVALNSFTLDFSSNRLGQKVVLVLGTVVSHFAKDGFFDDVLPSAFFGEIDRLLGVLKEEGRIAAVGIRGRIPIHQSVLPSLSDRAVVVK